jgi:hypothetical protein
MIHLKLQNKEIHLEVSILMEYKGAVLEQQKNLLFKLILKMKNKKDIFKIHSEDLIMKIYKN